MKVTIENVKVYERTFAAEVCEAKRFARKVSGITMSLDDVASNLRRMFPGWFVYRGGNHVALHAIDGDARRLMLVTE